MYSTLCTLLFQIKYNGKKTYLYQQESKSIHLFISTLYSIFADSVQCWQCEAAMLLFFL